MIILYRISRFVLAVGLSLFLVSLLSGQNNALHFDGIDDFVDLGNIGSSGQDFDLPQQHTLEAWVNLESLPSIPPAFSFGFATILRNGNDPADEQFSLLVNNLGQVVSFFVEAGTSSFLNVTSVNSISINTWHHIAVVRESSTVIRLYIDCVEEEVTGDIVTDPVMGGRVTIGAALTPPTPTFPFGRAFTINGAIDELRIWDHPRSQQELESTKECALLGNEDGLVSYFNFDQGVAGGMNDGLTTLVDASANGNDGVLMDFALSGTSSNWVEGAPLTGQCFSQAIVPTLSQWSIIILSLCFLIFGVVAIDGRTLAYN